MKTIAFAAAVVAATVAVSAASTPAFAQDANASSVPANVKVRYEADTDRYCVRATVPSAIVPVVQCRSKADWASNGVTINHIKADVQLASR